MAHDVPASTGFAPPRPGCRTSGAPAGGFCHNRRPVTAPMWLEPVWSGQPPSSSLMQHRVRRWSGCCPPPSADGEVPRALQEAFALSFLIRVQLPDIPGTLGAVATALGGIGA